MSTLGRNGRLGNQLFQVAGVLGLAEHYGAEAVFPPWPYQTYFEPQLQMGTGSSNVVQEKYFHHHDWGLTGDSDLLGYLQSEKYFGSVKLRLKKEYVEQVKKKHSIFDRETVCIHVRRGDYVGNKAYHQLGIGYYIAALLEHFPNWRESNLVVISDDIEYCKVHWECLPNVTFGGNSDIEDMALASCCDHFIISNSSYGWWCAWLGEKSHSKIIHCGRLHAGRLSNKGNEDYYPNRWTEYKRDSYKVDLRDLTFTIPVHYDHQTRKENLDLSLYLLQSVFNSNYIICEQGGKQFAYTSAWAQYMQIDSPYFHRTRMLNEMCNRATTPYLANWDCDVMIPPMQIILTMDKLRSGVDMVYPYDGGFARMPRAPWYAELNKFLDIGIVRNATLKGRSPSENSAGGAVFWNKESFIEYGMENEHFISFGPEDGERMDRTKTLGGRVERVNGSLFHLNHHVGPDSSPKNPYFNQNVAEHKKVHGMSRQQLYEYVNTWPWRHQYTEHYRQEISEGSIRSAQIVIPSLPIQPKSVLDVGCGNGEWSRGFPPAVEYTGIDYRIRKEQMLVASYIECNLNKEFPVLGRKYDLALCLEVAEHLHPSRAEPLVQFLCKASDIILFSAAIPFQGGTGHVNEQWQSWWGTLFQENGYGPVSWLCPDDPEIEFWYRQNTVLYQRGVDGKVEDFILPAYYIQICTGLKAQT
jgi:SAM-dependent methyltransferase